MNPLQSGTSSSQLSPQNFKNTNQASGLQRGTASSTLQSPNSNLLVTNPNQKLQVIGGNNQSVLAAQDMPAQAQSSTVWLPISFALIFIVLSVYFYRRYSTLTAIEEA